MIGSVGMHDFKLSQPGVEYESCVDRNHVETDAAMSMKLEEGHPHHREEQSDE